MVRVSKFACWGALLLALAAAGPGRAEDGPSAEAIEKQLDAIDVEFEAWMSLVDERDWSGALPAACQLIEHERALLATLEGAGIEQDENLDYMLETLATTLQWLASHHEAEDELDEALAAHKEVLALRSRLYLDDDWMVVDSRRELADVERLLKSGPALRKKAVRCNQLNRDWLALDEEGKAAEALAAAKEMFALTGQVYGAEHAAVGYAAGNLAALHQDAGQFESARPLFEQGVAVLRKSLGVRHPDYAMALYDLATLRRDAGEFVEAEKLFIEARDLLKKVVGRDDPDYAECLSGMADLYTAMGDSQRAAALRRRVAEILGPEGTPKAKKHSHKPREA